MEQRTSKVSLIGTFNSIVGTTFPLHHPFCLYAVLTGAQGNVTIEMSCMRLDNWEEVYRTTGILHFTNKLIDVSCLLRIRGCIFPVPGFYQITLYAEGQWVAQKRFHVRQREESPEQE